MKNKRLIVGTRGMVNGYPGTITKVCDWMDTHGVIMYEVRSEHGGETCVDESAIKPLAEAEETAA